MARDRTIADGEDTELATRAAGRMLSNLPLSLVSTDPHREDNPIVQADAAFERMTGYDASAVIGRNCRFLQGEDRDQEAVGRLRAAIAAREPVTVDLRNRRADGKPSVNRLPIAPIAGEDGEILAFLGVQTRVEHGSVDDAGGDTEADDPVEFVMQEMHHRVKNHLQMISSSIRVAGRGGGAGHVPPPVAAGRGALASPRRVRVHGDDVAGGRGRGGGAAT